MVTMLTESPLFLVCIGFVVTASLVFFFFQSNEQRLLPFICVGALLTIVPIITSMLVETKNERIKRNIFQMANCVRQNDVAGLLRFVDPKAPEVSDTISREMPTMEFSACNVSGFQSVVFDPDDPDQVTIKFNVMVNVNAPKYNNHNGPALRGVELRFHRQANDSWLVNGYKHYPRPLCSS
jgi:hypothetical protein